MLLVERLKQAGDFEAIGGAAYLAEVAQSVPYAANAVYYAQIVRDKATLRALIHASTEILRDAYDTTRRARRNRQPGGGENLRRPRPAQHRPGDEHPGPAGRGLRPHRRPAGARRRRGRAHRVSRPGQSDRRPARFGIGHPGRPAQHGQDGLGHEHRRERGHRRQRADAVREPGNGPAGTGPAACSARRATSTPTNSAAGSSPATIGEKLVEASAKLSKAPLFVDDTPSRTVTEIAACARRLKRKHNLGLVVIDYLQLIQPDDPRDPRQEQVAKMARRLKILARELKIPVLCLAQLNRQAEAGKEGHRPRLSHLRESGAIEQDADVVMFIHREEYYQDREEAQQAGTAGVADLIVAKQRNGPTRRRQARLVLQIHPLRESRPKTLRRIHRIRLGRVLK